MLTKWITSGRDTVQRDPRKVSGLRAADRAGCRRSGLMYNIIVVFFAHMSVLTETESHGVEHQDIDEDTYRPYMASCN